MAHHKRTLYISDLDGTLLNEQSVVSPATARRLNTLIEKGLLFTIATARTPATVVGLMEQVDMRLPVILMTGALVYDLASHQYLAISSFPQETATRLIEKTSITDLTPMLYYIDNSLLHVAHRNNLSEAQQAFVNQRIGTPYKKFVTIEGNIIAPEKMVLLFYMGEYEKLRTIHDAISSTEGHSSYLYRDSMQPSLGYLEIYPSGTSKATAITQIAQLAQANEIVAFGDNHNDLPMFEVAHRSYAVANAIEAVKEAATHTIEPNHSDGVVTFLESDFK